MTSVTVYGLPGNVVNGTNKRRAMVAITGTFAASETFNVATYVSNTADIEGMVWYTVTDAVSGTAFTWSTTTLTTTSDASGASEIGVIVNFT